ncbi:MAG: tRNA dihydrouridine(20/20a) synthase DusA [Janthinobacterium lividum]
MTFRMSSALQGARVFTMTRFSRACELLECASSSPDLLIVAMLPTTEPRTDRLPSEPSRRFSVAPMMDWTDRHCRFFLRLLSKNALLYTEMVTTGALLHGDTERFLRHDETEHPLALQLGGSNPADLAASARLAQAAGYDEVNLNVGCPSDRVQNNMIGAVLMGHPQRVADCVKAMRDAVTIPVTVKHRIGINGRDSYEQLCDFVSTVRDAGCTSFTVHARIAILEGLSPKENRDIPPLRYDIAAQLKQDFPELEIILNGGIKTLEQCQEHLNTFDGVMLGREAYHNPYLLAGVDRELFGSTAPPITRADTLALMRPYVEAHLRDGGSMHHITRHVLGLGTGFPGARKFRQMLSVDIHKTDDPLGLLDRAGELLEGR